MDVWDRVRVLEYVRECVHEGKVRERDGEKGVRVYRGLPRKSASLLHSVLMTS